jgi:hypothetical protein
VEILHLVFDLFPHDRQILRGLDADAHYALGDSNHGYGNIVPDENFLANFSGKNEHDISSGNGSRENGRMSWLFSRKPQDPIYAC